jgi:electron transfer flavoprotein alpha subunit
MEFQVVVAQDHGEIKPVTRELLGRARELAEATGGKTSALVLGAEAEPLAKQLGGFGVSRAVCVSSPELGEYRTRPWVEAASAAIRSQKPDVVLVPATMNGREFAASLAAALGAGIAADVTEVDAEGSKVTGKRPVYGGRLVETVEFTGDAPWILSVRPRAYPDPGPGQGDAPEVVTESPELPAEALDAEIVEFKEEAGESVNLADADVIVAGGRGIQDPSNFQMVKELADELGGAVGASRAVVDAGWIPYPHQVGQTGKTVRPKLYVAIGISGAIQHLAGMKTSETIVAINKDSNAPIFKIANWGVVGDALQVVPLLTKKIREKKGAGSPA